MRDHMEMTGEKTTGDLLELQLPSGPRGCLHGLEMKGKAAPNLLPTKPEYSGNVGNDHFLPISFPVPSVIL